MSTIPVLFTFTTGGVIVDSELDSNFQTIRDAVNTYGLFTDVARTVTAAITFAAGAMIFAAAADVGSAAAPPRDGYFSRNVLVGAPAFTVGAAAGDVLLKNGGKVRSPNNAANALMSLIGFDSSDRVVVGSNAAPIFLGTPAGAFAAFNANGGDVVIANARSIRATIAAGNDTFALLGLTAAGVLLIGGDGQSVITAGGAVATGAAVGDVVLGNNKTLRFTLLSGANTVQAVSVDANDRVVLAGGGADIKIGRALIALGGGAAPTFGTIGGGGPTVAAQNTWMKFFDSTGAACFAPIWK